MLTNSVIPASRNIAQNADIFEAYPEQIRHLVAQRDIIFSNSMIEAINKSIKWFMKVYEGLEGLNGLEGLKTP